MRKCKLQIHFVVEQTMNKKYNWDRYWNDLGHVIANCVWWSLHNYINLHTKYKDT